MNIFDVMQSVDRRVIYVLLALVIAIPLLKPIPLPLTIAPETQQCFDFLNGLPDGGVLWIGGDYDSGSATELTPVGIAAAKLAFKKNMKIILYSMWNTGATQNHNWLKAVADEMGKQYGVDWVDIGWKAQASYVLRGMTDDIVTAAQGTDFEGNSLASLPLMQQVKALTPEYVDGILDLTTGSPGAATYLNYVIEPKGVPCTVAVTAVSSAQFMPNVRAGQYKGLTNGLSGAAEFEKLAGFPGKATAGIGAQAFSHALIILLIILGNIGYVVNRRG